MTTVQEIQDAIEHLPQKQFSKLHDWIIERDWRTWDAQIDADAQAGKLDFLLNEAKQDRDVPVN
jgi:hypothetical protein